MKKLVIELPEELSEDIIAKAARFRKGRQRQALREAAQRGGAATAVNEELSDEDYLIAGIKEAIINDYAAVVKAEAMQEAGKKALEDLAEKLKTAK